MRIGIITAHYMPEVGYQEVHLARAYARIGHQVRVFTSAATVNLGGSVGSLSYKPGITRDTKGAYDVLRLKSLSYKSKVIPFGLKKAVYAFNPDVLVILGVAKVFPRTLLNARFHEQFAMVSVYGDASEYLDRNTWKQKIKAWLHELGYATIKKPLYKKAVKYGDKIILNIPETDQIFRAFLKGDALKDYEAKRVFLNLGYDPEEYYFTEEDRREWRKKLNVKEQDIVLMTSTRVNRRKGLEQVIRLVSEMKQHGKQVHYVMVGFLGDAYEQELKAFIQSQPDPSVFHCYPFLNAAEIRRLYCAADAGIWLKAAISIQEAMGTGLPVILENKPSVNHLLKNGVNGWFYEKGGFDQKVKEVVDQLSQQPINRQDMVKLNAQTLSYDHIAQKILDTLEID
ncbi:MAG: glycosyltransferase family 4 protein [Bacteroidetes bacterium]|nr:glycosyltransferase family 4 protein [Bacteroidota bacterium]